MSATAGVAAPGRRRGNDDIPLRGCKSGTYAVGYGDTSRPNAPLVPPAFFTMKTILTTDWAPHIEVAVRRLAAICAAVYTAGYITGAWVHRLNDQLAGRTTPVPVTAFQPMITQRLAPAATPANIALPTLIDASDPMLRAIRLVQVEDYSQRHAASLCGVGRSALQRALKG